MKCDYIMPHASFSNDSMSGIGIEQRSGHAWEGDRGHMHTALWCCVHTLEPRKPGKRLAPRLAWARRRPWRLLFAAEGGAGDDGVAEHRRGVLVRLSTLQLSLCAGLRAVRGLSAAQSPHTVGGWLYCGAAFCRSCLQCSTVVRFAAARSPLLLP
jgi:hypothetical protein